MPTSMMALNGHTVATRVRLQKKGPPQIAPDRLGKYFRRQDVRLSIRHPGNGIVPLATAAFHFDDWRLTRHFR